MRSFQWWRAQPHLAVALSRVPRALTCNPALIKTALALLHWLVSGLGASSWHQRIQSWAGGASSNQSARTNATRGHTGGRGRSTVSKNVSVANQFRERNTNWILNDIRKQKGGGRETGWSRQSAVVLKDLGHDTQELPNYRLLQPGPLKPRAPVRKEVGFKHPSCAAATTTVYLDGPRYQSAAPLQDVFHPLDLFLPQPLTQIQSDVFTGKPKKRFLCHCNFFSPPPFLFLGTFLARQIFRKLSSMGCVSNDFLICRLLLISCSEEHRGAPVT